MKSGNIHLSVTPELHTKFSDRVGNVTQAFKEYMENVCNIQEGNTKAVDVQILKKEIELLTDRFNTIKTELDSKVNLLKQYEEELRVQHIEQLKQDLDNKEKERTCVLSGEVMTNLSDAIKTPKGYISKRAWLTYDKKTINKLFEGGMA